MQAKVSILATNFRILSLPASLVKFVLGLDIVGTPVFIVIDAIVLKLPDLT